MFYLNTRVHFDKVMLTAGIYQELYSTCTAIVYRACNFQSVIADCLALFFIQAQSRTEFNYFLMTTLDRTVTFKQMYQIAVFVTQHLYFDVFWIFNVFFYENGINTKCFFRFAFCTSVFLQQVFFVTYNTHTATATTGRCF